MKIYKSNVEAVLQYNSETCKLAKQENDKKNHKQSSL